MDTNGLARADVMLELRIILFWLPSLLLATTLEPSQGKAKKYRNLNFYNFYLLLNCGKLFFCGNFIIGKMYVVYI